jgi:hypothetical protein
MPLTSFQREVLSSIAQNRDPESYIAGGTVLQRTGIRFSNDIDIFHDRVERLAEAVGLDNASLIGAGFTVDWRLRSQTFYRALVSRNSNVTRLEWVIDAEFRFFPTQPDAEFGYALHPIDLATNKLLAAASRFEPRDAIDVLWIDEHIQPVGAVAWAAVEKDPGWTPEAIIAEIRAKARYRDEQLLTESLTDSIAAGDLNRGLREATGRADRLLKRLPCRLGFGALLRPDGSLAQPDPDRPETLEGLVVHHGSRKGAWPSSPEIGSVMLRERR